MDSDFFRTVLYIFELLLLFNSHLFIYAARLIPLTIKETEQSLI